MEKSAKVGKKVIVVIACGSCPHYGEGEKSGECLKYAESAGVSFPIIDRFVIDPICPLMDFQEGGGAYYCECGKIAHLLIVDDSGNVKSVQCSNCFAAELEIAKLGGHKPGTKVTWN